MYKKHKTNPRTITSQPLCHPPRITMQAQDCEVCSATKEPSAAVFAAVSPCRKAYCSTRPPKRRHYKVYQQCPRQCMGCFTLRPLCMQYLVTLLRPREDVPRQKAYIFLGLLPFARQNLTFLLGFSCSVHRLLEKRSSRGI